MEPFVSGLCGGSGFGARGAGARLRAGVAAEAVQSSCCGRAWERVNEGLRASGAQLFFAGSIQVRAFFCEPVTFSGFFNDLSLQRLGD